ncbi:hypothetical protein LF1_02500 [Rubripirellula obstinata]|uniref:Uncharacterized protein n=2 Tax=Rubripirellula obstinata TaxID=406547 RepID=A0A5B1CDT8_9BACT|nr:hypothetical protein LF1_02500 [Rubripirellula obstinata]
MVGGAVGSRDCIFLSSMFLSKLSGAVRVGVSSLPFSIVTLSIGVLMVARGFYLSQSPSLDAIDPPGDDAGANGPGDSIFRGVDLVDDPVAVGSLTRSTTANAGFKLSQITGVVISGFDPDALVVLTAGPDGKPGRAGIDDGGNGVTDERTELGATGSDDVCRVVFGEQADRLTDQDQADVLIVQRGAFRPIDDVDVVPVGTPVRELVRWTDEQGRSCEMLRDR